MLVVKRRPQTRGLCPLCRDALDSPDGATCLGCNTRYHLDCFGEMGGCATLGCRGSRPRPRRRVPIRAVPVDTEERRAAWAFIKKMAWVVPALSPIGALFGYGAGYVGFKSGILALMCAALGACVWAATVAFLCLVFYSASRPRAEPPAP